MVVVDQLVLYIPMQCCNRSGMTYQHEDMEDPMKICRLEKNSRTM